MSRQVGWRLGCAASRGSWGREKAFPFIHTNKARGRRSARRAEDLSSGLNGQLFPVAPHKRYPVRGQDRKAFPLLPWLRPRHLAVPRKIKMQKQKSTSEQPESRSQVPSSSLSSPLKSWGGGLLGAHLHTYSFQEDSLLSLSCCSGSLQEFGTHLTQLDLWWT